MLISGLIAVFLLMLFTPAIAESETKQSTAESTKTRKVDKNRMKRMGKLNLTDEQEKKISAIKTEFSFKMEDIKFEMQKKRFELAEELRKDEPDQKNIDRIIDELSQIQKKRHTLIVGEFMSVRKILTPEQNRFFVRRFVQMMMKSKHY